MEEFTPPHLLCSYVEIVCFYLLPNLDTFKQRSGTSIIGEDLLTGSWSHGVPGFMGRVNLSVGVLPQT